MLVTRSWRNTSEGELKGEALRAQRRVFQDGCGILAEPAEFL
jgi:hypothetical protein